MREPTLPKPIHFNSIRGVTPIEQAVDLMTIDQAATQLHMSRTRLRMLCIANGIAIRWGGSDASPRLKVPFSEAVRVVKNQTYSPPGSTTRRQVRRSTAAQSPTGQKLNKFVTCM